jgi:hypothetical protein
VGLHHYSMPALRREAAMDGGPSTVDEQMDELAENADHLSRVPFPA